MSHISTVAQSLSPWRAQPDLRLAAAITRAASQQAYFTVRFLVDRDLVPDAYRAYAYFRWVDDQLDQGGMETGDRLDFVNRQKALSERCYRDERPGQVSAEENLLLELVQGDREKDSGLQVYIRSMLRVMAFDASRRGRLISQAELACYTRDLAAAVTEALHYFIGHGDKSPRDERRYLAASAAHIIHMLRDTFDDVQAGYFNIPREYLQAQDIEPHQVWSDPYRRWVQSRVEMARAYFQAGRSYLAQVENPRCRLAGLAYIARFGITMEAIEQDGYRLRAGYPERKSLRAGLRICQAALAPAYLGRQPRDISDKLTAR